MRTAIYARYSTELQREASIEDQVRVCRRLIEVKGWTETAVYSDMAISGANHLRPGYQQLLRDLRLGEVDVVVAEGLDRISRDQEHVAACFKQAEYANAIIVTVAEGEISELHIGLKGTMAALFLKDLAQKTHRGLEGRVRQGRSAGGISYGYRVRRELTGDGSLSSGEREIDPTEAAVIRRIYRDQTNGHSTRRIAIDLNKEGIPAPRSGKGRRHLVVLDHRGRRETRDRNPDGVEPPTVCKASPGGSSAGTPPPT
jgi:DNA invertase Pin-like site-specific DNA recombinase